MFISHCDVVTSLCIASEGRASNQNVVLYFILSISIMRFFSRCFFNEALDDTRVPIRNIVAFGRKVGFGGITVLSYIITVCMQCQLLIHDRFHFITKYVMI